ncbi:hypothetical protein LTR86_002172 [Recurvomyces mirabilis]|nr:hypothetical protein LTR86_002172 [Recurvomyces mirabilis]
MAEWSELVYDRSEAPPAPMVLHKRAQATSTLPPSITEASSTVGGSTAPPATGISTASPTSQDVLPTPFDSSIGNNFTSPSCPAFFQSFLTDDTFKQCSPLSLLLQTSNGFFTAETSPVRLAQTLDASCSVNYTMCASVMASLAQSIQLTSHCGRDLQMQNPTVMQAYNGLLAYQPIFHAGCLTDSEGNYCFANAVQNKTAPTSSYIYYLPLGVQLPAGTSPACNTCLQQTMTIFGNAAGNKSLPLSMDYTPAAQQIDIQCGPQFVVASVAHTSSASTHSFGPSIGVGIMALVGLAISTLA